MTENQHRRSTDHDEDQAAFPRVVTPNFEEVAPGMTLRDYFATAALSGLLAADTKFTMSHDSIATLAVAQADAMIKAREL